MRNLSLGILGGGRAAWAYGSAWRRAGQQLSGVWLREQSTSALPELLETKRVELPALAATSDVLLVAVSDRAIVEVVSLIPATSAVVMHASGALASIRGGFSLHPLKSLPPVGQESDLAGTLLVFEGAHRPMAQEIAAMCGARFAEVAAESKPLYHSAAVFGSNYVAAMLDVAEQLMREAGVEDVRADLVHLAESAIANWIGHSDARRFTGPAIRGDHDVMARHLAALATDSERAEIYRLLAAQIAGSNLATGK
jgi:predicted short-subunit dehydrogenase-like oxidoreductase (DUF2520 family)